MTDKSKQLSFNVDKPQTDNGPVVCLGMTFKNDDERREFFRNELRKKLPELKKIEGFPIGDDEDIIALSDPPYYTACPNPWINDFIEEWEKEKVKEYGRNPDEEYHREPFAADVSEGKKDPVYNAHSYHTKVPYKAIMRYILHYTDPGDIVFDGFSGTGMTGIAAQMCGNEKEVESLGYKISNGGIIDQESNQKIKVGSRKNIVTDLSPAATYISQGYNNNDLNINKLKEIASNLLNEIENECKWMYETRTSSDKIGTINYTVWSDVYTCPNCGHEIVFYEEAVDSEVGKVKKEFNCPNCQSILNKRKLERLFESKFDKVLNKVVRLAKQKPVLINYSIGNESYEKIPDHFDLETLEKIEELNLPITFEKIEMPDGYNTAQPLKSHGYRYVHQFYFKRNLYILSLYKKKVTELQVPYPYKIALLNIMTGGLLGLTKLQRYRPKSTFPNMILSGTLYVGSMLREWNAYNWLRGKLRGIIRAKEKTNSLDKFVISCSSSTSLTIDDNSVDYIFTDPPFGANLMYSELNTLWESLLNIFTNNETEAIENSAQGKSLADYKNLMLNCFMEFYRILKPGRWITVEFSNSKASVWNTIQDTLQKAGFIVANVSALDKQQGTHKAITSTTAVKKDLVISAYKPTEETVTQIKERQNTVESAWIFVAQHLEQLPTFYGEKGEAQIIPERTPRILFDSMVAYHVQNGLPVPISSAEFQLEVAKRFPMRDGMAFLENQVAEYDRKRTIYKEFSQLTLFVSDENSAIEWIRQQLYNKPQTRQELHPEFMKQIQHLAKHEELPELDDLLEQNFLRYDGEGQVPNQILTYLRRNYKDLRGLEPTDSSVVEKALHRWYVPDPNKQSDLEKLREKALLREFNDYVKELEGSKKKLRTFRTEAVRAGFKNAYKEKDFETIVKVGDRIPEKVIQEDDKLFMFYENAKIRLGL